MSAPGPVPAYGTGSLAEVTPSLLAALGVPDLVNTLGVPAARGYCLLLIDGLGSVLLREHAADAPFLAGLATGGPLTAGFPATTATSVATLGTGLPPGEHGVVGYSFAVPEAGLLLNALYWRQHDDRHGPGLLDVVVPEELQPRPTAIELAERTGVRTALVIPPPHRGSGLTRAVLRGGASRGAYALGDLTAHALAALAEPGPVFCYAYHGDLDLLGHLYGPGSAAWRAQLRQLDVLAAALADGLPDGCGLAVVADHGMVGLDRDSAVDADAEPDLLAGVRLLGGDVRARHVYAEPGAAADVLAAWRSVLGERAWVLPRDEAVALGLFGPVVAPAVLPRIGDVLVLARGGSGVLRGTVEPVESRMIGHHGSLSPAELNVPFLLVAP